MSEGERGKRQGQGGDGLVQREVLGFYPEGGLAWEGNGQGRDRTWLGAHGRPLVAAAGRTGWGWLGQRGLLVQVGSDTAEERGAVTDSGQTKGRAQCFC